MVVEVWVGNQNAGELVRNVILKAVITNTDSFILSF